MSTYTYGQPLKGSTVATYPKKRTCSATGCSTRLSIYNSAQFCGLHASFGPRDRFSPTKS